MPRSPAHARHTGNVRQPPASGQAGDSDATQPSAHGTLVEKVSEPPNLGLGFYLANSKRARQVHEGADTERVSCAMRGLHETLRVSCRPNAKQATNGRSRATTVSETTVALWLRACEHLDASPKRHTKMPERKLKKSRSSTTRYASENALPTQRHDQAQNHKMHSSHARKQPTQISAMTLAVLQPRGVLSSSEAPLRSSIEGIMMSVCLSTNPKNEMQRKVIAHRGGSWAA